MPIKNAAELIANGSSAEDRRARALCLTSLEAGLESADPGKMMTRAIRVSGDSLQVQGRRISLARFRRIIVIGGGKASGGMAEALESIMGDRISGGIVNVPLPLVHAYKTSRIDLHGATHPLPNENGVVGVSKMLELVGRPTEDTLVVCLLSGGGSALMPLPRDGLSLEDKVRVTRLMLKAGATIQELNVVRKHLSGIKGGLLAERLYPCTVFAFVISDIVGNPLNMVASGPLSPDPSTFGDALSILKKHKLENLVLDNAMKVIFDGTHSKVNETPKPGNACFRRVHHFLIGSNEDACRGALRALKEAGCTPLFLTSSLQGDARQAGAFFAAVSKDLNPARRTRAAWLGLVIGGETTVVVEGSGKGGRNQEAALAAAIGLGGIRGASVACMGTDGLDGPTDSAGAVVDGSTLDRAANLGLDPREFLTRNDSHTFFRKMGDLLVTGPTGTNVNDVWVSARSQKSASPRPL